MSIWFQYESLLYISYPIQIIAKSIKIIPVMILGKFVSGQTYSLKQYLLMLIMVIGFALFLSGFQENNQMKSELKTSEYNIKTINGFILLLCYLVSSIFV